MYDRKCEDLARDFLGERVPENLVVELAQVIQDTIEEFIDGLVEVTVNIAEEEE